MKLTIVIPAYNEEQAIAAIIERTLEARAHILADSPVSAVEIVVVSDGSTDQTVAIARSATSPLDGCAKCISSRAGINPFSISCMEESTVSRCVVGMFAGSCSIRSPVTRSRSLSCDAKNCGDPAASNAACVRAASASDGGAISACAAANAAEIGRAHV